MLRWYHTCSRHTNSSQGLTQWPPSLASTQLAQCSVHPLSVAVMKTASRAQPRSSPPLVQMRRYTPGVYPFLFPSVISSLPQLPPPSPHRLQIQQPSSSGSTPSPVGEFRYRWFMYKPVHKSNSWIQDRGSTDRGMAKWPSSLRDCFF